MGAFKNVFIFEIKLYPVPSSFPAPWAFPLSFPEPIPCFCILKLVTSFSLITVVTYVCYMYAFDCWVHPYCLCVYVFKADNSALHNQEEGSPLGETHSPSSGSQWLPVVLCLLCKFSPPVSTCRLALLSYLCSHFSDSFIAGFLVLWILPSSLPTCTVFHKL